MELGVNCFFGIVHKARYSVQFGICNRRHVLMPALLEQTNVNVDRGVIVVGPCP